jgi:hypothetical protein
MGSASLSPIGLPWTRRIGVRRSLGWSGRTRPDGFRGIAPVTVGDRHRPDRAGVAVGQGRDSQLTPASPTVRSDDLIVVGRKKSPWEEPSASTQGPPFRNHHRNVVAPYKPSGHFSELPITTSEPSNPAASRVPCLHEQGLHGERWTMDLKRGGAGFLSSRFQPAPGCRAASSFEEGETRAR